MMSLPAAIPRSLFHAQYNMRACALPLPAPPRKTAARKKCMTYCCGILVRDGLVMIGDTRTNAGLDNISTFRKLQVFQEPGKYVMALATAGNLSLSQTTLSILNEGM